MVYKKQGGKRRTQKDYTVSFKLEVVAEIERGDLSKNVAKYKYGIQGRSTILKWLKKYGTLDWNKPELHILSKSQKPQTPEQRIKELEALLEQEKQKNLLLNTMVSIAEKDYGLQIRKKSSPVQRSNSSNQEN
jgi:transposase-like protein